MSWENEKKKLKKNLTGLVSKLMRFTLKSNYIFVKREIRDLHNVLNIIRIYWLIVGALTHQFFRQVIIYNCVSKYLYIFRLYFSDMGKYLEFL